MLLYAEELDTPCLVVDLDKVDRNIAWMAGIAREHRVGLRPHVKTHKTPELARRQLEAGATGITVAKLGEAELFADAGCEDILVAYQIVGAEKIDRLIALSRRIKLRSCVDSLDAARELSAAATRAGVFLEILLDVDTGLHRTGCAPEVAADLAGKIGSLPGLIVAGVFTFAGYPSHDPNPEARRAWANQESQTLVDLRRDGVVSVAGTPCAPFAAEVGGVTEIRPGTYVFGDANCIHVGVMSEEDCALVVRTRVVSRPARDRAVLDAGSKVLTSDLLAGEVSGGFGRIVWHPKSRITRLWEEHAVVALAPEDQGLAVGDAVSVIPNHVCPAVNLADQWYGTRDGVVEETFPVAARGLVR